MQAHVRRPMPLCGWGWVAGWVCKPELIDGVATANKILKLWAERISRSCIQTTKHFVTGFVGMSGPSHLLSFPQSNGDSLVLEFPYSSHKLILSALGSVMSVKTIVAEFSLRPLYYATVSLIRHNAKFLVEVII
jgi:hypothetical protein